MLDAQKVSELKERIGERYYISTKDDLVERAVEQVQLNEQFHRDLFDACGLPAKTVPSEAAGLTWDDGGAMALKLLEMTASLTMLMAASQKPPDSNAAPPYETKSDG